jgi:hypothetical protein
MSRAVDAGPRNRLLGDILNVYGKRSVLIAIVMLAHVASSLLSVVRNHERGTLILAGLSQIFKSSLLKVVASAIGCSGNVVGERHSTSAAESMLSSFATFFDDIGKSGKAAKFKLADLAAIIRVIYNVGQTGSYGKQKDAKCSSFVCLNMDGLYELLGEDDDEQTMMTRAVQILIKDSDGHVAKGTVRLLSPTDQECVIGSLASLKFDNDNYEKCLQEVNQSLKTIREQKLLATDLVYAKQILQSFITENRLTNLCQKDLTDFVEKYMCSRPRTIPSPYVNELIRLKSFVEQNPKLDKCDVGVFVPMSIVFPEMKADTDKNAVDGLKNLNTYLKTIGVQTGKSKRPSENSLFGRATVHKVNVTKLNAVLEEQKQA